MDERQTPRHAPSADEIEAIARDTIARLPEPFARHLEGVVLRVEEFAEEEVLAELGIDDAFDLTGLYTGRPIGDKSSTEWGTLPDMIHLYRRPILDEWAAGGEAIDVLVRHIVIHEIGHHFGLSDADMHALEDAAG